MKTIKEIVDEFKKSWDNPTWGRDHNASIPAFYDPGAEEGDYPSHDETKIEDWLQTTLTSHTESIISALEGLKVEVRTYKLPSSIGAHTDEYAAIDIAHNAALDSAIQAIKSSL